jgi:hypothetical protein
VGRRAFTRPARRRRRGLGARRNGLLRNWPKTANNNGQRTRARAPGETTQPDDGTTTKTTKASPAAPLQQDGRLADNGGRPSGAGRKFQVGQMDGGRRRRRIAPDDPHSWRESNRDAPNLVQQQPTRPARRREPSARRRPAQVGRTKSKSPWAAQIRDASHLASVSIKDKTARSLPVWLQAAPVAAGAASSSSETNHDLWWPARVRAPPPPPLTGGRPARFPAPTHTLRQAGLPDLRRLLTDSRRRPDAEGPRRERFNLGRVRARASAVGRLWRRRTPDRRTDN